MLGWCCRTVACLGWYVDESFNHFCTTYVRYNKHNPKKWLIVELVVVRRPVGNRILRIAFWEN